MRFISIILDPGHLWSDHGVIDLHRQTLMCRCSREQDADTIAATLNLQHVESEAKQLTAEAKNTSLTDTLLS